MSLTEPLRFEPVFVEKVWGSRSLEPFLGHPLPGEGPVGEVWSLVDRDGTSSRVAAGAYAGRSLRGLMLSEREALLGRTRPAAEGTFPLLVKYLDVSQPLSVQVHPDAKAVQTLRGGSEEKSECWYVLDARPGAFIHLGFREGVEPRAIGAAASSSELTSLLATHPVRAGDFVFVPAGSVHAIGGGITLVEVQQNSDTTYRIYDWGRVGLDGKPRELHVEEALRAIDYERRLQGPVHPAPADPTAMCPITPLVDDRAFAVRRVDVSAPYSAGDDGLARVLIVLGGRGSLGVAEAAGQWEVSQGQTWLVPACLGGFSLTSADGELSVLDVETRA